ncbi:MAG TPA: class I SAM-dependent methyltransferase [Chloroflexota bacterium]|nr:class I SAM-dependent methyltransferase [Chloroflexota bacterium]
MHAVAGTKDARLSACPVEPCTFGTGSRSGTPASVGYDAIAAGYDEQVRGDTWMRQALHAHYRRVFRRGDRVLDVGCGTGIDAIALARLGVRVLGVDGSAGMIERLTDKIAAEGLANLVEARVLNIQDLGSLREAQFDGVISAFASLSSLPTLAGFAGDAARLVRPGGRLVLHLLNRFSGWEWLGYVAHRRWRAARQVGRQTTRIFVIGGQPVPHWLYFADDAYRRYFSPAFTLRGTYGLGALRPPHTVRRIPAPCVKALEWLDVRLGGLPLLRNAGRFFVLDLERRPT